jgi:hypothetical protein
LNGNGKTFSFNLIYYLTGTPAVPFRLVTIRLSSLGCQLFKPAITRAVFFKDVAMKKLTDEGDEYEGNNILDTQRKDK